jgi:hypothetical protein
MRGRKTLAAVVLTQTIADLLRERIASRDAIDAELAECRLLLDAAHVVGDLICVTAGPCADEAGQRVATQPRRRRPGLTTAPNGDVVLAKLCECGCGDALPPRNPNGGRIRRFIEGHNPKERIAGAKLPPVKARANDDGEVVFSGRGFRDGRGLSSHRCHSSLHAESVLRA